jgi:hypothetical protein
MLACLRWGFPGHPNGYRFAYLTTLTAVVAAAGVLVLLALVPIQRRRAAAAIALGLVAISGVIAARDALFRWGEGRDTFVAYQGHSTLIGRAALRWQRFGSVRLDAGLPLPLVTEWIRTYRLDPDDARNRALFGGDRLAAATPVRCFRIRGPMAPADPAARRVESIQNAWGEPSGTVFAVPCGENNAWLGR